MSMKVTVSMSGLIAYAIRGKKIDALLLASREMESHTPGGGHEEPAQKGGHEGGGHDGGDHGGGDEDHTGHMDVHLPVLIIPLQFVKTGVGSAASNFVLDAGSEEYGIWLLADHIVEVKIDGKDPDGVVGFTMEGEPPVPTYANEHSLFWLPNLRDAAGMEVQFRADCLPPKPDPAFVTAAVRVADGRASAMWSSVQARKDVFTFVKPDGSEGMEPYEQALADGLSWELMAEEHLELHLRPVDGGPARKIVLQATAGVDIPVNITNKTPTLGGVPAFDSAPEVISHFSMFYDLVEPVPPADARRVPTPKAATTKTNRCPGSAG